MVRGILQSVRRLFTSYGGLFTIAATAAVAGLLLSAGYAEAVHYTNSTEFCAHSCHEMERTVYREYAHSRHYRNSTGVVVTCAQCHTPRDNWRHAMANELRGASRLWAHMADREYLPGRFEARRAELAKYVLADFKASNARECKSCHAYAKLAANGQSEIGRRDHISAMKSDSNCLDCHQGVVHHRMDAPASYDFP